jgi:DNA polymerase-3 subunit delta'
VIRVKEVRDTTAKAHQTRGRAGHRFVIVDSIDNANTESDNALLKVLEEPPNDMTFILVSHRPSALPPTVLSRTQKLALRPLSNAEVAEILAHSGAGGLSLQQAVALAQGRPRRGFEALAVAGVKTMTVLLDWLKAPALQPLKAHLDLADALGAARDSAETKFARDLIVDWIAAEARAAALAGEGARLASANRLWDKARTLFAEVDVYNLDMRQTLTALFDAIRNHLIESPAAASP